MGLLTGGSSDTGAGEAGGDGPPGLARARLAARLLDDVVSIPGTSIRVGFDPLLSVVPGGTLLGGLVSLYIVLEAIRYGVPIRTVVRMLGNIALDTLGGAIPLLGPILDATIRANRRNVRLFERSVARQTRAASAAGIDPG